MEKVTQSVRMLGTSFFNEMIGQKASKGKIYESQVMLAEDQDDFQHDGSAYVADEYTEDEFVSQLLQDDDEDAALIADYESMAAMCCKETVTLLPHTTHTQMPGEDSPTVSSIEDFGQ